MRLTRMCAGVAVASLVTFMPITGASAAGQIPLISEVESKDGQPGDWIELTNPTDQSLDLSGYIIRDNDDSHEFVIPQGTILQPGQFLVFDELGEQPGFDFGLGGTDSVRIFDTAGVLVDSVSWTEHAETTYIRAADGSLVTSSEPTKGSANAAIEVPAEPSPAIVVNEVQYDDVAGTGQVDAVELYNAGETSVDLTGYSLHDDKERPGEGDLSGTLAPGQYLVLENDRDFFFGLGKGDSVVLKDPFGDVVDRLDYDATAPLGNWSRCPDGTGEFAHGTEITLGGPNNCAVELTGGKLVLNEIDSAPADYIELFNAGDQDVDLAGVEIRDNSDDHRFQFTEGSIKPGEFLVVDANTAGLVYNDQAGTFEPGVFQAAIGIGSGDSIRLYDSMQTLIDEHSWTEHASLGGDASLATLARCPDGAGAFALAHPTLGAPNDCVRPAVEINEVESNGDATDWVEIINISDSPIDISGWYILDNDPIGHANDVTPLPDGTILEPGALAVFDGGSQFTFGLGANDSATVYNAAGMEVVSFAWTEHAEGVFARCPDGVGDFVDISTSTPGQPNACGTPVVFNEVTFGADGWVELVNTSESEISLSQVILVSSTGESYQFPADTVIPALGYLQVTELGFEIPQSGALELHEGDTLLNTVTWENAVQPSFGRCPDVNGDFAQTSKPTPGERNSCPGIPDLVEWNGSDAVTIVDDQPFFLADSSGLDYHDGILWAVDNGIGGFWKLHANQDGSVTPADGWETPKRARFIADADNPGAAGPDAEGITYAGDGFVYIAVERDNSDKGVNFNAIMQIDPEAPGPDVVSSAEWDITALLPQVSANMGIEAIEWVPLSELAGRLIDETTGAPLDPARYPNAVADGIFFVALEDNGHVYALVLDDDGSAQVIADIDSQIGGAMALNYDTLTKTLWVVSDNGFYGLSALIDFDEQGTHITHMSRPGDMPNVNNEGFALSDQCTNGVRPAWFFQDGVTQGSLTSVMVNCELPEVPGEPVPGEPVPGEPNPGDSAPEPIQPNPETDPVADKGSDTPDQKPGTDRVKDSVQSKQELASTGADVLSLILIGILCLVGGTGFIRSIRYQQN